MKSFAANARLLNETFQARVRPLLAAVAQLKAAHVAEQRELFGFNRPPDAIAEAFAQQLENKVAAFETRAHSLHAALLLALDSLVESAREQEIAERPGNAQRESATRDAARLTRTAAARQLLQGQPARELQALARTADPCMLYAARTEATARASEPGMAGVIGALNANDGAHTLALAHVFGAQHVRAQAIARGPLLDLAPVFLRPLAVASAAEAATTYRDEAGTERILRADVTRAMLVQCGAIDDAPEAPGVPPGALSYASLMAPRPAAHFLEAA